MPPWWPLPLAVAGAGTPGAPTDPTVEAPPGTPDADADPLLSAPALHSAVRATSGALTAEAVRDALHTNHAALDTCYRQALAGHPHLAGDLTARVTFGRRGAAADLEVTADTTGEPQLRACLSRVLWGLRAPGRGSAQVYLAVWDGRWPAGELSATIFGTPLVLGALPKADIAEEVTRHTDEIRACYQAALDDDPGLTGKVTVKFAIAPDGSVLLVQTKQSTLQKPTVEACLNGRFASMRFPETMGGGVVFVSYPFIFSPG